MRQTSIFAAAIVIIAFAIALTSTHSSENGPDPILESFEREFNREPAPTPPVRRDDILDDELYKTLNSVHWTQEDEQSVESEVVIESPELTE